MTSEHEKWEKLKTNYLRQIEHVLATTHHPKSAEVLRDVDDHLDRKYAELPADKQNWEGYQQILIDMGPPEEYAELLTEEHSSGVKKRFGINEFLAAVFVVVLMVVGGYLIYTAKHTPPSAPASKMPAFESDKRVLGKWVTVDFVESIDAFDPDRKSWEGALFLSSLFFEDNGTVWWTNIDGGPYKHFWTKGKVDPNGERPAFYYLKSIDGVDYLFFEWISGDVRERGMEPRYYVLTRHPENTNISQTQPPVTHVHTSIIQDDSDPTKEAEEEMHEETAELAVTGKWKTVDFVQTIDSFKPEQRQWHENFYLKSLTVNTDGSTSGPWTWRDDYLWHPDDQTKAHFVIQQIDGAAYLFMEWMSGDVTIRGEKPWYYVLKKVSAASNQPRRTGRITAGAGYCTADYVRSVFGPPQRVESNGRLLDYPEDGINFWFSKDGVVSEIRLNPGFRTQLETGISLSSTKQDVFRVYGSPARIMSAPDLHRKNDERILYQKDNISRIYYGGQGLIFWFRDNAVMQIVVFKGSLIFQ